MTQILSVLVAALVAFAASAAARGQTTGADDWTATSLTSRAARLFTPTSGALLAATTDGLMRSDDAGDTWYPVAVGQSVVSVGRADQDTLFAAGDPEPLLKSTDGGITWKPLMVGEPFIGKVVDVVAESPADPGLLYAGLKRPGISDEYWLYRSTDAGSRWTEALYSHNSTCGWSAQLLVPHPTDPTRLYFSGGGCHAGRDFFEIVRQSADQGQTFADFYANRQVTADAPGGFPKALIGGQGAASRRWYLAINRDQRLGGSVLLRSDDDGATWDSVLDHVGGGTFDQQKSTFSVSIAGVAYDAADPDTVYVARNGAFPGFPPTLVTSGVTVTHDGGQTWSDLGGQQVGAIVDLALGIDDRYLFLATDAGVARLALQ